MKPSWRLLFTGVVALCVAVAAVVVWRAQRSLDLPLKIIAPVYFKVVPGARFTQVVKALAAQGIVTQPRALEFYGRWKGVAAAIKAGEYELEPGLTARGLLAKMISGQVLLHSLTIVDGWRVQDLLLAMRRNPDIVTKPAATKMGLMEKLGFPGLDAEGQFLPETYRFPSGTSDIELLREAHAALIQVLNAAWQSRDPTIPLRDPNELLIMSSIVEKESALPQELPQIAGLYLHRLSVGMRLQADPTIIYGMGDAYDGGIRTVDLRSDGPYNTYTRNGLPPTAIALPGAAAIEATARPAKTDAIFFVASGKADGSHVFSATLEEQNIAVAHYLARRREKALAQPRQNLTGTVP